MRSKFVILTILSLTLAGCATATLSDPSPEVTSYPDLGPAEELTSNIWLNTDKILRLADMRGKVVLIDMWTFG